MSKNCLISSSTIASMYDLSGKVAIVTGGGNGIGRSTALLLAEAGASVVVADIALDDAKRVAEDIQGKGGLAIALYCDILDDASMVQLINDTVSQMGGLHILVNVAGGGGGGRERPDTTSIDIIERDFQLNVYSVWRLIQLAAPHMKTSGYGAICTVASMGALTTSPGMSGYAGSKAAVTHMCANLAFDLGPMIRINCIGPGATKTHALASVLTLEMEERMIANTPLKRLGTPMDMASAILFLVSPASSWVNGQTLFVNGGGVQTLE